jgi:DNA-binding NarL/FixJ family response regulator
MIRLLCVEDDPITRGYLVTRLTAEPDMEVVSSVSDVARALIFLHYDRIDVVLLDYQLPGRDGISMAHGMAPGHQWPQEDEHRPKILFCTGYADEDFCAKARLLGAQGVISKDRLRTDLVAAVRAVARGDEWFNGEIQRLPGANQELTAGV